MIQASLRIVPPAEKRLELRNVMRALIGPTEVAKGCFECRVLQDAEDDGGLTRMSRDKCFAGNRLRNRSVVRGTELAPKIS